MAGTFTHWMVVEEALDRFNKLPGKYPRFGQVLQNNHFIILGAVGPDYPYLSEVLANALGIKVHSWADRMHYGNTDAPIKYGVPSLVKYSGRDYDACLSWLLGYSAHLLTDSIIHPVVNAIVGPYIFNSTEHRKCEMVQDSLIFKEIKNVELAYDDYFKFIKQCSDKDDSDCLHPSVKELWSDILRMSHPSAAGHFDDIQPDKWHENFLDKIDVAANPNPIAIVRHFEEAKDIVYRKSNEISDDEREKYYDNINLPMSKKGKFKDQAFNMAVDKVVDVWQKLLVDIDKGDYKSCATYLRNWNLDTGVDEDAVYFWG